MKRERDNKMAHLHHYHHHQAKLIIVEIGLSDELPRKDQLFSEERK